MDPTVGVDGYITTVTGALTDFSPENMLKIVAGALVLGAPLFLAWFAYRFIKRKTAGAMKKGSI